MRKQGVLRGELVAEHSKAQEKHSVMMKPGHYRGIPMAKRQGILGGRQILIIDGDFYQVQKRSLKDYDHVDRGGF